MFKYQLQNRLEFNETSLDPSQETPDLHGFVMMGIEKIFFCHLPMFFVANHRYQVIFEGELGRDDMETYLKIRKENPGNGLIIGNQNPMILKDIINSGSFLADAYIGMPDSTSKPFMSPIVTVKNTLLFEHLNPGSRDYPESLACYLYGTNSEFHISHLISKATNFQQELDVTLPEDTYDKMKNFDSKITKISIPSLNERGMQPITTDPFTKSEYTIKIENDGSTGTLEIGSKYWFDATMLNME